MGVNQALWEDSHVHDKLHTYLCLLLLTLLLAACGGDGTNATPLAPTGLTATPGEGNVTVRWQDNSTNETGFSIYRREASATTAGLEGQQAPAFSKLDSVGANVTEYEDTSAKPGMLYRYGVTADGVTGSSALVATEEDTPVAAGNRAPTAKGQSLSTPEDVPIAVTLKGSDPDGDALTYSVVTAPAYGTLSGDAPKLLYTPNKDYNGKDAFTFTVSDGQATSAEATVTLTVGDVNDAPVATAQEVSTEEDTPVTITLTGSDAEGEALSFAVVTQPSKGSLGVVDQATGKVVYTPKLNETGADSFTFTVSAGGATSAAATVTINLGVVNDAPVAKPQTVTTEEDTAKPITLSATDDDGDSLTYTVVTLPLNGTLSGIDANQKITGALSYTPKPDYFGPDSFTFKANDGNDDSNIATVGITVEAVNDAPTALALDNNSVKENEPVGTVVGSFSTTDIDSSSFTYSLVKGTGGEDNDSFTVSSDKLETAASFDFETKNSYNVRVQVSDGEFSVTQNFTVSVIDVNEIVSNTNDSGPGSLRQVLADAPADFTVTFAANVAGQTITLTGSEIVLDKNLTIDGNITIDGNANSRIFNVSSGATVVLKDLTVTNGIANNGGGIYNQGTLTLQGDASISGNRSNGNDGGVYNLGTLTLQDSSSISGNTAPNETGGVYNGGTLTLQDNSSISNNTAKSAAGGVYNDGTLTLSGAANISDNTVTNGVGGGVVIRNGTVTLEDSSIISGNTATTNGGGVYSAPGSTMTLRGSSSINNNASNYGGGVLAYGTSLTLSGTASISSNTAAINGGGVFISYSSTLTVEGSASISGNTAGESGGGVHNRFDTVTLKDNASIGDNSAQNGGGVTNENGTLEMSGTASISNNTANVSGGGVWNYYGTLDGADYDGANGDDNIFGNTPDQVSP